MSGSVLLATARLQLLGSNPFLAGSHLEEVKPLYAGGGHHAIFWTLLPLLHLSVRCPHLSNYLTVWCQYGQDII